MQEEITPECEVHFNEFIYLSGKYLYFSKWIVTGGGRGCDITCQRGSVCSGKSSKYL